jgi:hypothetical protein
VKRWQITYRAIGSLDRPTNLKTETTESQEEEEEAALRLLKLREVVIVLLTEAGRNGLLEQAIGLASAVGRIDERRGLGEGRLAVGRRSQLRVASE